MLSPKISFIVPSRFLGFWEWEWQGWLREGFIAEAQRIRSEREKRRHFHDPLHPGRFLVELDLRWVQGSAIFVNVRFHRALKKSAKWMKYAIRSALRYLLTKRIVSVFWVHIITVTCLFFFKFFALVPVYSNDNYKVVLKKRVKLEILQWKILIIHTCIGVDNDGCNSGL